MTENVCRKSGCNDACCQNVFLDASRDEFGAFRAVSSRVEFKKVTLTELHRIVRRGGGVSEVYYCDLGGAVIDVYIGGKCVHNGLNGCDLWPDKPGRFDVCKKQAQGENAYCRLARRRTGMSVI